MFLKTLSLQGTREEKEWSRGEQEQRSKRREENLRDEKKNNSIFNVIISVPAAVFLKGFCPLLSVRWPLGSVAEFAQIPVMLLSLLPVAVMLLSILRMAAMLLRLLC